MLDNHEKKKIPEKKENMSTALLGNPEIRGCAPYIISEQGNVR